MSNQLVKTFQGVTPDQIRSDISGNQPLLKVIQEKMGIEQFTEAALSVIQNPYVAACTKDSIFGCLLKAAIFGFRLSPELGQCWIVPRSFNFGTKEKAEWGKVATFQIGYKGWQELVFRSGKVESFDFATVRENDNFDFQQGTNPSMSHKWLGSEQDRGKRSGFWASATLNSGRVVFHYCPLAEVERHRMMSDTQKDRNGQVSQTPVSVWGAHYDIMAMRVPMRYLCTLKLPKTDEIQAAIESDGAVISVDGKVVAGSVQMLEAEKEQSNPDSSILHEDYISEVEACTTISDLEAIWKRQSPNLKLAAKDQYSKLVTAKKQQLTNGAN